ncbi:MAG TPA: sugar ABC transporter permease [Microbacteriaceae bacterium]|jgi:ABC-type xylose transport system, permease component
MATTLTPPPENMRTSLRGHAAGLPGWTLNLMRRYGLIVVLLVLAVVFQVLTDDLFLSSRNVPVLLRQAAITGIVACGVCLVIVTGEIDLSIGSAVGLCAIAFAFLAVNLNWPVPLAVFAAVVVGILIGAWQGFLVTGIGVPAFVVTLGGLLIFRGMGLVITGGNTISGMPPSILWIGSGMLDVTATVIFAGLLLAIYAAVQAAAGRLTVQWLRGNLLRLLAGAALIAGAIAYIATGPGLPVPVAILALVGLCLSLMGSDSRFGRQLYAIGGNREAARLSAVPVRRNIFLIFAIMGLLYAVAALVLVGRLNGAPPDGAPFLELDAIAAAVIGGTSLMGGVGRVGGAVLGAVLTASVSNGLSLMNVNSFYQMMASGLILITAVAIDIRAKKNRKVT